jgi:hypothetical protein
MHLPSTLPRRSRHSLAAALAGLLTLAPLAAQQPPESAEPQLPPPPPVALDDEVRAIMALMTGSFATDPKVATDASPALHLSIAPVGLDGLPPELGGLSANRALYFEVARADDPANPFRQGLIAFYRRLGSGGGGQLQLRLLDIGNPNLRDSIVGLWAAPEAFPPIAYATLNPRADLGVTREPDGTTYVARTAQPVPTVVAGAVEVTSSLRISSDGITLDERALGPDRREVWNSAPGGLLVFSHAQPAVTAQRLSGGLIAIDLISGDAQSPKVENGCDLAFQYTQWLSDGTRIDSSRTGSRGAYRTRFPLQALAGLDQGMTGMAKGGRRRIIIPSALGYGEQGRGPIPAGATLIFDIECMWLQPPAPAPEGTVPGPVAPPTRGGH